MNFVQTLNAVLAGTLLALAGPVQAREWTVQRIEGIIPTAFNNAGQVLGFVVDPREPQTSHPYLWQNGTLTDLGGLGGPRGNGEALNDAGQAVGASQTSEWGAFQPALFQNGTVTRVAPPGTVSGRAAGINAAGDIVGEFRVDGQSDPHHIFLYRNGEYQDLGNFGRYSIHITGFNDQGHIAGYSRANSEAPDTAFLIDEAGFHDLGTLGGDSSYARGINNAGQVFGEAMEEDGSSYGFVYENGVMRAVTPPAFPVNLTDMNDHGQIVGRLGWSGVYRDGTEWIRLDDEIDLPGSETLDFAYFINNRGQIVAQGGGNAYYLLTPVPEPETYALMLAGLGLSGWLARRRRAG